MKLESMFSYSILLRYLMTFIYFSALPQHVTGRGCSTKDKVFYKECETHQSDQVEIMCFCSYFLCNASSNPTKTGPKNVFTLVWFIILVAVLNKVLNTLYCTQYHVCQTPLKPKKNSKIDKKLLAHHSKKQICQNEGKTNHNENIKPKLRMFERWMHGKNCVNSSPSDIVIISEYFNEQNLILTEEEQWQEMCHFLNSLMSSKELKVSFLNEYHKLIKRAQNQCLTISDAQSCSKVEVSHFVSNHVSSNDESFITCLPYGGRKMETLLLFMPKHSALKPVTMTRTGS